MSTPASNPRTFGDLAPSSYPGERLGVPRDGSGSVARAGRRIIALCIDWGSAMLITLLFASYNSFTYTWLTPVVFLVLQVIFIPTIGGSIGHRLLGMRVVAIAGGWVGIWRPIVRSVLLTIVLPALVWDSDQRGFHDKIAGTILLRV